MASWFDDPSAPATQGSWFDQGPTNALAAPSPWDYPGQGGWINEGPQNPTPGAGATPPAAPSAVTAVPSGRNASGRYTSADIANLWKQLTGREATAQEAKQWGDNIDQSYYDKIVRQISQTPEAQTYQKQQQNPKPPTDPTGSTDNAPARDWSAADYSDWNTVKAYAQSRGVTMSDETAQYWAGKYNSPEFNGDRGYFFQRLSKDPAFGPDYTAPWGQQYTPPTYTPPPAFQAPDPSQVLNDPAIKLQMQESLKALQRSALSRGTLLTGATATDVDAMAQQVAAAGYDKLYQRAVGEDQMKYSRNLDEYGIARDNTLAQYQDQQGTFYNNQDRPFQKQMQISGLGMNALNAAAGYNAQYAGQMNNALFGGTGASNGYYTSAAAANGAGRIGAQNAWSQALGNSMNSLGYLYGQYMNGRKPQPFNQANVGNS